MGAPQSVFATAVKSGPFSLAGNRAAFGGIRGGQTDDDDDEEEEKKEDEDQLTREASVFSSGAQSLELREDTITFDQVSPSLASSRTHLNLFCP